MAERIQWEYFIVRRHIDPQRNINYYKGDTKEPVCIQNADESQVLVTFGQHGYELCTVQMLGSGDLKYYLKRPVK